MLSCVRRIVLSNHFSLTSTSSPWHMPTGSQAKQMILPPLICTSGTFIFKVNLVENITLAERILSKESSLFLLVLEIVSSCWKTSTTVRLTSPISALCFPQLWRMSSMSFSSRSVPRMLQSTLLLRAQLFFLEFLS